MKLEFVSSSTYQIHLVVCSLDVLSNIRKNYIFSSEYNCLWMPKLLSFIVYSMGLIKAYIWFNSMAWDLFFCKEHPRYIYHQLGVRFSDLESYLQLLNINAFEISFKWTINVTFLSEFQHKNIVQSRQTFFNIIIEQ